MLKKYLTLLYYNPLMHISIDTMLLLINVENSKTFNHMIDTIWNHLLENSKKINHKNNLFVIKKIVKKTYSL